MKISDLQPNGENPRKISDKKLEMLKKALKKFGDISGIVYNRKTHRLVGGHQRKTIFDSKSEITITKKYPKPTKTGTVAEGFIIHEGEKFSYREVSWDDLTEKAANIAANKGAGEWDLPQLTEWLKELNSFDANFDLNLTMFENDELFKFKELGIEKPRLSEATGVDEDEVPEKVEAISKLGDIYVLGQHRLMCGDSTSIDAVEKLMDGEKADMVFTDPPYGIDLDTNYESNMGKSKIGKNTRNYRPVIGDDQEFRFLDIYALVESIEEQIWFGADYYCDKIPKGGSWFVWNKRTSEALQQFHGSHFELAWSKQKHQREIAHVAWSGAFGHNRKDDGDFKVHPTMKAVKLIEWFFDRIKGDKVIDLFGGSGSTLIACEKTNRKCFMMELDPHYVDVIVARWEKYTGKKAELISQTKPPIKSLVKQGKKHGQEKAIARV